MDPNDIRILKDSFAQVVPIRQVAADLFYARLFELEPDLRRLFAGADMTTQGAKLMAALGLVVAGIERPETLLPQIETLAARHVTYGVEDRHYAVVGRAFIDTLEKGLGASFTAEVRAAWVKAYGFLSSVMIAAAYRPIPGREGVAAE
jgi:hemoglobin-like flavoprotein